MTLKTFNFPDAVPLRYDSDGNIRVTDSRITIETIVCCLEMGDTPEDIQDGFPSLTLDQINAIIGWYLNNQADVDEYIREGEEEAEKLRQEIESWPQNIAFKEKMRRPFENN